MRLNTIYGAKITRVSTKTLLSFFLCFQCQSRLDANEIFSSTIHYEFFSHRWSWVPTKMVILRFRTACFLVPQKETVVKDIHSVPPVLLWYSLSFPKVFPAKSWFQEQRWRYFSDFISTFSPLERSNQKTMVFPTTALEKLEVVVTWR